MDIQANMEVELYSSLAHHKVIQPLEQDIVEAMIVGVLVHLEEEA